MFRDVTNILFCTILGKVVILFLKLTVLLKKKVRLLVRLLTAAGLLNIKRVWKKKLSTLDL